MAGAGSLAASQGLLAHQPLGRHHHRAEGDRLRVVQPLPVHRQAEEAGGAEGLDVRRDLLEVATRAFLAVIHAHHHLRRRRRNGLAATGVGGQGAEQLLPVMPFVGLQPELAAQFRRQSRQFVEQRPRPGGVQACRCRRAQLLEQAGQGTRLGRRRSVVEMGDDRRRQHFPGAIIDRRHDAQAAGGGQQVFRQASALPSIADQELGRMRPPVSVEFGQSARAAGQPTQQLAAQAAFEEDTDGQVIGHCHRRPGVGQRMPVATQEHAGPAGHFQSQAQQGVVPARLVRLQLAQLRLEQDDGVVRQVQNLVADVGQFIEFPGQVATGARFPGGVEALTVRRVTPGRHAQIQVRRQMALQDAAHRRQHVFAAKPGEQAAQAVLATDAGAQRGPAVAGAFPPVGGERGRRQQLPAGRQASGVWRRRVVGQERRQPHLAATESGKQRRIEIGNPGIGQRSEQVALGNPAGGVGLPETRRRPVAARAGHCLRRRQCLGERQVLETVQGIVVHEIADRCLRRQDVLEFGQPVLQALVA